MLWRTLARVRHSVCALLFKTFPPWPTCCAGGPVPQGADAVVQIEDTQLIPGHDPARVNISRSAQPGEDVRQVGSDVRQGELVLPAGTHLGPAEMGILATVGATQVKVQSW